MAYFNILGVKKPVVYIVMDFTKENKKSRFTQGAGVVASAWTSGRTKTTTVLTTTCVVRVMRTAHNHPLGH